MSKRYNGHMNEKCQVVSIFGTYVYPIHGAGYKTLFDEADMTFTNHELRACPTITVLLQDPFERFKTSVHSYCEQHKKGIQEVYEKNTLEKSLISVLGGGDTLAAINKSNEKLTFSHLSTAGGAFLEYLEGKDLPGISVLK